ncbi:Putative transposase [Frankia alni ACN14a]|uniref:Transposase n=1 Tax=Frankia alni (strain DSM 45986 / CECT 9034 / ACN14a) TaxID=326424 RepID=Q0RGS7_FRAAA|nr:Putative transposase [Frankia alni ACN14a]
MSSADQPAPSYDELVALIGMLRQEVAEARRQAADAVEALAQATAEISELKARLGKNSRNSSKPPSSEGLAKPAPKSRREKSARSPGGQPGHPGSTLVLVADPDRTVLHEPECCRRCGDALLLAPVTGLERRQVVDVVLPAGRTVTEHRPARAGVRRLRCPDEGGGAARGGRAGPVRRTGPRPGPLSVRRTVPLEGPHRAGDVRAVRDPVVGRHDRRDPGAGDRHARKGVPAAAA